MEYDLEKIDDTVLALLCLTLHESYGIARAWKNHDWDVLDRLHQKGWISDPKDKAKSVVFTEDGLARARQLFEAYFRKAE